MAVSINAAILSTTELVASNYLHTLLFNNTTGNIITLPTAGC